MFDPCGVAGGRVGQTEDAFNAAEFNDTKFAKQGDRGSVVLKERPSGTVWTRGQSAVVRFQLTANHVSPLALSHDTLSPPLASSRPSPTA